MNAPDKASEIKAAITAAIAFCTSLFGWAGWAVVLWFGTMVLDYITGTWAAMANHEWSSTVARQGLWHKLGSIVAVLVAGLADIAISVITHLDLGFELPLEYHTFVLPLVALWYAFTEMGSLIENAGKLGAPVPKWLSKGIKVLCSKVDVKGEQQSESLEQAPTEGWEIEHSATEDDEA